MSFKVLLAQQVPVRDTGSSKADAFRGGGVLVCHFTAWWGLCHRLL